MLDCDCAEHNVQLASDAAACAPLGKGVKLLLPHELKLLNEGKLINVTHPRSSSVVLAAPCVPVRPGRTLVFRPMGDIELAFLIETGTLPATQPYQAIVRGHGGRVYANKFVDGLKKSDANPTTVVEFDMPSALVDTLFATQHKAEDGALSHGLGRFAGRTLPTFNACLTSGEATFRVVRVKRRLVAKSKA